MLHLMKVALIISTAFLFVIPSVTAQDANPWMRYPAISPDGKEIAFSYLGHIFVVPAAGGIARPLTLGDQYDYQPVWSPDGKQIAFASDRHGNFDVFIMPAKGGGAKRLTHHSANDVPQSFSPDGQTVYFTSLRTFNAENSQFPYGRFTQLYRVSTEGARPESALSLPLEQVHVDRSGKRMLYIDLKGYEDVWRKHHISSVTRDIWMYDTSNNTHTQLTTFAGEDRNPVWAADQNHFYFLSERSGTSNVWKAPLGNPTAAVQVSSMVRHPVRFLTLASNDLLCYGYHGAIYTQREGQEPVKVNIELPYDVQAATGYKVTQGDVSEMSLSPNGKEIALVVRGDIYVTGVESGLTKRITDTPEQERSVSFSTDGRKLVYAGERNGSWNIYETTLSKEDEPYFYASTLLKETVLVETDKETFQPAYSPDGKEVAYLEERTTLKVFNLASKTSRVVLPGDKNYSYSDGDQHYKWSPDSKWFLVSFIEKGRWVDEVGLVKADGKEAVINLTESGYNDGLPTWALEGKAAIFASDKQGYRSHGSWGSQSDVYIQFFEAKAWDRFNLSKDALDILKEQEKEEKEKKEKEEKEAASNEKSKKSGGKKKDTSSDEEAKEVEPLTFDLDNAEDRTERLTLSASFMSSFVLSPDGEKLYYLSTRDNSSDLWELTVREKKVKTLHNFSSPGGELYLDSKGEKLYILNGGSITSLTTADGTTESVSFKAELTTNGPGERAYYFEHMWRQVDRKFYVEDLHGVDWVGLKKDYEGFLPHIENNRDFAEMMSELLGELNGSHTGCRYFHNDPTGDMTAALGIVEDLNYRGPGIRIAAVLDKSPLKIADAEVRAGMIIEAIDGQTIEANQNYYPFLNRKAGKLIHLQIADASGANRFEVRIKAISQGEQAELLYQQWVKSRRAETERLSGGRLGYVHVRGMNSESFREVYAELLGRYNDKEAVIVDTRFNGGGWLHDDLATLLSGKQYVTLEPRGQKIGSEPQAKWQRPSVVLAGEGNYSDAHFFPVTYRALNIGPIIGMPIPGTTTAVWWERQVDPTLVFGIPQVGVKDMQGQYLENQQLEPDIQVKNMPGEMINGKDSQLEKAVEVLLQGLD
jgi:tricorn protease